MKPWDEVKRVFGDALDRPPEERDAFVRDACGGDDWVRAQVATLLRRRRSIIVTAGALRATGDTPEGTAQSESVGPKGRRYTLTSTAEDGGVGAVQELAKGAVLVERYLLGERIGAGASGAVHRAKDQLTGQDVAVKILITDGESDMRALRRETAVLRRARLPGVVELLDDGVEHGWAFLVMKLVEGRPFPAADDGRVAWEALSERAFRFLDAVGRLHWLGVLHRDLKPDNVLVDAQGRVTVVDLGIAHEQEDLDGAEGIAGTLPFLSLERLLGRPASIASDLFAAGVMLWEALAGEDLGKFRSFDELKALRERAPRRVDAVAPAVPRHVADAIARMLDPDPAARPRSVREALSLLRNGVWDPQHLPLPWVGEDSVVRAIVDSVKAKTPLDIAGPQGCGRTRSLQEAEKRLVAEGYRVLWTRPGTEPFESLASVVGEMPQDSSLTLDDLRRWLRRCLHFRLDVHVAVFADDWTALDAHSREILQSVRASGPLIRALDAAASGALVPPARTEQDLRELFHGPDRIFHLREDGARELHRRTAGRPGDCVRELVAWIDGGRARWEDGLCRIERTGLERLESDPEMSLPPHDIDGAKLSPAAMGIQRVLERAGCALSHGALCELTTLPASAVELAGEELVGAGLASAPSSSSLTAIASCLHGDASDERFDHRDLHQRIAEHLPCPSARRLHHLVLARLHSEAAGESMLLAEQSVVTGHLRRANELALEGARCCVASSQPDSMTDRCTIVALKSALALGTLEVVGETGARLASIAPEPAATLRAAVDLLRAASLSLTGRAAAALDATSNSLAAVSADLEDARHTVRSFASRHVAGNATHIRVVIEAWNWSRRHGRRELRPRLHEWIGWIRYSQAAFRRAVHSHSLAARRAHEPRLRAHALLNAGSAALEAGDIAGAVAAARQACGQLAEIRVPYQSARAEWLRRAAEYRSGRAVDVDHDLVAAAMRLEGPGQSSLILLTEAAIAWRAGRQLVAAELAVASARAAASAGRTAVLGLANALAEAAGGTEAVLGTDPPTPAAMPPLMAVQVTALSGVFRPGSRPDGSPCASIHPQDPRQRLEVLSIDESLERMDRATRFVMGDT